MTQAVTELIVRDNGSFAVLDRLGKSAENVGRAVDTAKDSVARYDAAIAKINAAQEKGIAFTTQRVDRITTEQRAFERLAAKTDPIFALRIKQEREAARAAVDATNARLFAGAQEADLRRMLTKLDAQHAVQMQALIDQQQRLATGPAAAGLAKVGTAAKLTSNQMLNLSRQGNDAITMFALGASPMQIFASQAGQIYDALEQGPNGVRGSLKAIGDGLLSLITRFPVATAAIAAAGAAFAAYQFLATDEIESADDAIREHSKLIKSLEEIYSGASTAAEEYGTRSTIAIEAAARRSREVLAEASKAAQATLAASLGQQSNFSSPLSFLIPDELRDADAKFSAFAEPIRQLRRELAAGTPDFQAFREEIDRIAQMRPDLSRTADQIHGLVDPAEQAAEELGKTANSVKQISEYQMDAARTISELNGIQEAARKAQGEAGTLLKMLQGIDALAGLRAAPKGDRVGSETMDEAQERFREIMTFERRIGDAFKGIDPDKVKRTKDEAEKFSETYDKLIQSAERHNKMMGAELEMIGRSRAEYEGYRLATGLYYQAAEAAAKNGQELTDAQIEKIKAVGVEYAKLAQRIEEASLASDLMFEREQIGRSETEQRVAAEMRRLHGDSYKQYMDSANAAGIRFNERLRETQDQIDGIEGAMRGTFGDMIDLLYESGNATEKLIGIFANLGKTHAPMKLETLMEALKGKSE